MKTSNDNDTKQQTTSTANIDDSTIELEPFIHQVGGRSTILVLGKYICKPINDRELLFYESIDNYATTLKPFIPQYYGMISVNFEESNDGYMIITTNARLLEVSLSSSSSSSELSNNNNNNNKITKKNNSNETSSSDSPYQKFITKYRIKLVRPIKEIIIESHEQDIEYNHHQQNILSNLESANNELNVILGNKENNDLNNSLSSLSGAAAATTTTTTTTNLNRSRSTSISIPNFEDGNFNHSNDLSTLFDNQFFINEVGQNGYNSRGNNSSSCSNSNDHFSSNKRKIQSSPDNGSKHSIDGQQQQQQQTMSNTSSSPRLISYNNLSTTKHNPWVLKTFSVLSEFNESMKEQKFILLENLTSDFEYPCIMDLKMGTRLHDDHATQTKIQSHESKVNETTSRALGLRVTGIQIYDKELDKFICYNKYYGRKLTPETFRSTLKMFISNENFYNQHKLLDKMIERLQKLRTIIVGLDSFRFYTSSLLLIYEGNTCHCNEDDDHDDCESYCHQESDKPMFDVRVIDFAHSTHANLPNNNHSSSSPLSSPNKSMMIQHHGYDEGFVYGLDNLVKILSLFRKEYQNDEKKNSK